MAGFSEKLCGVLKCISKIINFNFVLHAFLQHQEITSQVHQNRRKSQNHNSTKDIRKVGDKIVLAISLLLKKLVVSPSVSLLLRSAVSM